MVAFAFLFAFGWLLRFFPNGKTIRKDSVETDDTGREGTDKKVSVSRRVQRIRLRLAYQLYLFSV